MAPILALTILLGIYSIGEVIANRTKATLSTTLVMSFLLAIGLWSGILPSTIFDDAGITTFGRVIPGLLITTLGTMIELDELRRQWKTVITGLVCVFTASIFIIFIGRLFMPIKMGIAGSPIFAGGSAATLIITSILEEKGLQDFGIYCISLYVTQKFIGIPVASVILKKEAVRFLDNPANIELYNKEKDVQESNKDKLIRLPEFFNRPSVMLTKISIVAALSYFLSELTNGTIHYFVISLIMGTVFCQLGFLEENILNETGSSVLITFFVTVIIFTSLANTSLAQLKLTWLPLLITLLLGTLGVIIGGIICGKVLKESVWLSIALGITCTFGFPTTMIMSKEIAEAFGKTPKEKQALENYMLPKMLTSGLVTVTIASVVLASLVVNLL